MQAQLLKAFQALDSHATMTDMREACRCLFLHSDEYQLVQVPFDPSEVDAVSRAIFEYILDPDICLREIKFNRNRSRLGRAVEYCEYASMFSEDMLYQNCSPDFASMDVKDLRHNLKTFLVGIFYRYAYCVDSDRAAFPVSMILEYIGAVKILLSKEQRDENLSDALFATLEALRALEPQRRLEEKITRFVEKPS